MKKFKIISLKKKEADQYNKYPSMELEIESESGKDYKAYAGQGKWNSKWHEGMVAEAEVEIKQSAKGNEYAKLSCPEALRPSYGGQTRDVGLEERVKALEEEMKVVNTFITKDDTTQPSPDETGTQPDPPGEEEVDVDSIPF